MIVQHGDHMQLLALELLLAQTHVCYQDKMHRGFQSLSTSKKECKIAQYFYIGYVLR